MALAFALAIASCGVKHADDYLPIIRDMAANHTAPHLRECTVESINDVKYTLKVPNQQAITCDIIYNNKHFSIIAIEEPDGSIHFDNASLLTLSAEWHRVNDN